MTAEDQEKTTTKNSSAISRLKLGASVNWLVTILSVAGVVLAFSQAHDAKVAAASAQAMHDQDRDEKVTGIVTWISQLSAAKDASNSRLDKLETKVDDLRNDFDRAVQRWGVTTRPSTPVSGFPTTRSEAWSSFDDVNP